ncbi:putative ribonuclease H-like domain-containing protein [Tanacetum coccineum]
MEPMIFTGTFNEKFLRSLPPSWSQIALIMRNKPDIDEIDIDDLYNNLRNTNSTNEVSTASGDFGVSTAGGINQVLSTPNDLEELDLQWQVAMLTVRVKKFIQRTGRNMDFKEKLPVSLEKSKIKCYNCHRKGHFARECRSGRSQARRPYGDNGRNNEQTTESSSQALVAQDGLGGYDWSNDFEVELVNYALMAISSSNSSSSSDSEGYEIALESLESRILRHEKNELAWGEKYKFQNYDLKCKTNEENIEKPKLVHESVVPKPKINKDKVIIDDWYLDDEDDVSEVNTVSPDNAKRVNHQKISNKLNYPQARRTFVPSGVLTRTGLVNPVRPNEKRAVQTINTARPVSTARTRAVVSSGEGKMDNTVKKSRWVWRPKGNYMDHESKENGSFMLKKFEYGNPEIFLQDHAVVDSGCSSHMTGNKAYLSDYEDYNGGFVAFGSDPKGGKITGKGKIKTANLDFDNVYFVDELKFNLFSVSQMCDKKNSVLFTDTECLILSPSFKLLDESQVVLRAPRKDDVYSLDLKNIVPSGGITCLYANATSDESKLWHRRLGHVNFKNINKLVKGHLVRGLPSKVFVNDYTCVACKKGKQHKASCKAKLERTIRKPLELLHMDLFGPVSVESINKKKYCLVVTDDFSRFSWVFFLATKDETAKILCKFIIGLKNQLNHKVKIIRCDHGTDFKNHAMNELCAKKWIKREFSVARTLQQNGVAERKNRTFIEAARTMLANSLLPIPFCAEVVNTVCYVLNRVLVTKPQNKTPYELLIGKPPSISFMRPFGCPLTILNTFDPLGKFDGKSDEDYLLGYFTTSKAFRVYNKRTKRVEENLHIDFLKYQPNVAGSGPDWMFDLDFLTNTMNYIPGELDSEDIVAEQALKDDLERMVAQEMVAQAVDEAIRPSVNTANTPYVSAASTPTGANAGESSFVYLGGQIPIDASIVPNVDLPTDPNMPDLEDVSNAFPNDGIFSGACDDDDVGAEANFNNMDHTYDNHDLSILDNQSIERDRLIGIGFVLNFVKFISLTFADKEMISMIEAVSR